MPPAQPGEVIRNWFSILVVVASTLVGAGVTYGLNRSDMTDMRKDIDSLKARYEGKDTAIEALSRKVSKVDRKVGLLLCKLDASACTSQIANAEE